MADLVCNIAKGRVHEFARRVEDADPATARFYVVPIAAGAATDDNIRDANTLADVITAGATELTTGGWNRKTLSSTEIVVNVDDSGNLVDVDCNIDLLWTSVTTGTSTDLLICWASQASPTNSQLIPCSLHDFPITPDGSDVTAQVAAAGFYRAQ